MSYSVGKVFVKTPVELVIAGESICNSWFRGQASEKWELKSTLERDAKNFGVPSNALREREQVMLRLFKSRAHLYIHDCELPENEFEWLSIIRHYGGPSRLLDVTTSYIVAAYFALSDHQSKQDAVVWAFRDAVTTEETPVLDTFFTSHNQDLKVTCPDRLNIRLHAQSGKFFVPSSVNVSLEDQIANRFNTDLKIKPKTYRSLRHINTEINHLIWKLVIPRSAHSEMFRFVSRCNVRAYSLVPGIDGLAVSLREMMRAYD